MKRYPMWLFTKPGDRRVRFALWWLLLSALGVFSMVQPAQLAQSDAARIEEETMRHFQAILRLDTSNPPGNEKLVVD